jgi:hypothetical protein
MGYSTTETENKKAHQIFQRGAFSNQQSTGGIPAFLKKQQRLRNTLKYFLFFSNQEYPHFQPILMIQ